MPEGRLVGNVANLGTRTITDGLLEILLSPALEKSLSSEEYGDRVQALFVPFPDPIPPGESRSFEAVLPRPDGDPPWDCYDFMFYA